MHSLRIKTTAITIGAILASLIAFALAGALTVGRATAESSAETMHLQSENVQRLLDSYLGGIEKSVELSSYIATSSLDAIYLVECGAADDPVLRSADQQSRLDAYIAQHCDRVQQACGSVAGHTTGIVTYYYCINPKVTVQEHGFFLSKMGKVGFEWREELDARELDPNDREHTTWYYTPIERGVPSWVGPYRAHFLGEVWCISFLTPIYKSGILIGVLGMDILFDTMVEQIKSLDVYDTGFACLLDEEGRVLYHPTLQMGEHPAFFDELTQAGYFQRESSGKEVIRYKMDGEEWQLSFCTLVNGMKLVVTAPVSEVTASWNSLLSSIPLIAITILGLFVPLTLLAMRSVIRPLQELTVAANSLAAGDYDVELGYRGKDEVGELTGAFRRLRDHLWVYISNLNDEAYIDALTGVRNESAYDISAARMDDMISRAESREELRFALVVFDCPRMRDILEIQGHAGGDTHLKATCKLISQIYGNSSVFRMGGGGFVVLLQGRDFANRYELLRDFDIVADEINAEATNPCMRIEVTKGMATFRPGDDQRMATVLDRAVDRMHANTEGM